MNPLDVLLPQPTPDNESWHWATVASTDPLRVQLDGDSAPLLATPENLAGGLLVGDRVWVQRYGRRLILHRKPTSSFTLLGMPGQTTQSYYRLSRNVGGQDYWFDFQAGASSEANLRVSHPEEGDMVVFRVGSNGQLRMSTYAPSGTAAAHRPLPFATAVGEVSVESLTNGNYDSYSVTFPSGRFTKAPLVFVNTQGTVPRRTFGASGTSTSGFTLRTANYSGGNSGAQTVHWLAVQLEV